MWVTLYTDASVSPSCSTWAVWARSEHGRIVEGDLCPSHVRDSNVAELYAAKMGIELIFKQWSPIVAITGIQINSDNSTVCSSLYPWSTENSNQHIRAVQNEIREFLARNNIRVRLKHVKGHQRPDSVRQWLNARCDKIANQVRKREERKTVSVKPNVIPNVKPNEPVKPVPFLERLFGKPHASETRD